MMTLSFSRIAQLAGASQMLIWGARGAIDATKNSKEFYSIYDICDGEYRIGLDPKNRVGGKCIPVFCETNYEDFAARLKAYATALGFQTTFQTNTSRTIKDEKGQHTRAQIRMQEHIKTQTTCLLTLDLRVWTNAEFKCKLPDKCPFQIGTAIPYVHIKLEEIPTASLPDKGSRWKDLPPRSTLLHVLHQVFKPSTEKKYEKFQWFACDKFPKWLVDFLTFYQRDSGWANCIGFAKIVKKVIRKENFDNEHFVTFVTTVQHRYQRTCQDVIRVLRERQAEAAAAECSSDDSDLEMTVGENRGLEPDDEQEPPKAKMHNNISQPVNPDQAIKEATQAVEDAPPVPSAD
jgi:uncharacterized membrane protein YkoI